MPNVSNINTKEYSMIKQSTEIVIQKFDIIYDEDPPKRFIDSYHLFISWRKPFCLCDFVAVVRYKKSRQVYQQFNIDVRRSAADR